MKEYNFQRYTFHKPNYDALGERFPETLGLQPKEIGKLMLLKYLHNEVTLEEIEECLNKPSEWEELVTNIQKSIANCTVDKLYGEQYPVFAGKVSNNVVRDGMVVWGDVDGYLKRQLEYYNELVNNQKIEPIDNGWLPKIEAALQYRKSLKAAEKAAKKEKRKSKNIKFGL